MDKLEFFRYKLTVEYDGTQYCGFQIQQDKRLKSIEGQLLKAIKNFTQNDVQITVAGRTDAGVHALKQIINFDLPKMIPDHQMIMGLNHFLKQEDIAIINSTIVVNNFNARFDAKMRHYSYIILNRKALPTLDKKRLWHIGGKKLDVNSMRVASNFLLGEHDFSAFRDAECQAKSAIRTIHNIEIIEEENSDKVFIKVSAKSFLHHMVRNIVGTLVWIGKKKIAPNKIQEILESKNRGLSGPNAPACGLYFIGVDY